MMKTVDEAAHEFASPLLPICERLIKIAEEGEDLTAEMEKTLAELPGYADLLNKEALADRMTYNKMAAFIAGYNSVKLPEAHVR